MTSTVATEFTPIASLVGGVLIGLSAVIVMTFFGRVAGIVGITSGAVTASDKGWRLSFLAGLLAAPLVWSVFAGGFPEQTVSSNLVVMVVAGLLVGVGTTVGTGCTSGHGVCGLARLSARSLAAVVIFMGFAAVTVFVMRHLIGGAV